MLSVYRVFVAAAAPVALLLLRWRGAGPERLRARWRERIGRLEPSEHPVIWVHAASVGEINGAQSLIAALIERYPARRIVVSTLTATGRARAEQLFGERTRTVFAPLDTRGAVRRWLDRMRPEIALIVETEIWPELFTTCRQRGIALALVNARLAPKAMRHYRRFRRLFRTALAAADLAACQSEADARRLASLGVPTSRIRVTGNLKFDIPVPAEIGMKSRQLRDLWGSRPVWVAGSTRSGEEEILIAAHRSIMQRVPEALLVLAPRHPERASEIGRLLQRARLGWQNLDEEIEPATAVVLVDRLGVLLACYAAAPVAFVGGSLVDIGGHNLLEPAAFGKTIITGPHLHQQADMAAALDRAGALVTVRDHEQLARTVLETWQNPEVALQRGRAALEVIEQGRGSLRRTLRMLEPFLPVSATVD